MMYFHNYNDLPLSNKVSNRAATNDYFDNRLIFWSIFRLIDESDIEYTPFLLNFLIQKLEFSEHEYNSVLFFFYNS